MTRKALFTVGSGLVALSIGLLVVQAQQAPLPTSLEIKLPLSDGSFKNWPYDTNNPAWARRVCGSQTWLSSKSATPRYEWMPILEPNTELETKEVGVSGTAFSSQRAAQDIWFTHPFGNDRTFDLATDANFNNLMAPNPNPEPEQQASINAARAVGLNVSNVLHVELDEGFVPPGFETHNGDRVAVFGRWIVDCGHENFAAEIHPPLLVVNAHAASLSQTDVSIVSRPFLVSQEFGDGGLFEHLVKELAKVFAPAFPVSSQITARPGLITHPFAGPQMFRVLLRPSTTRVNPSDELRVSYQLKVRSGISVQLTPIDDGTIALFIFMNESEYTAFPKPKAKNHNIPLQQIRDYLKDENVDLVSMLMAAGVLIGNPFGLIVLNKGIDTDQYTLPAPTWNASYPKNVKPSSLGANTVVETDDTQPWPILGRISLNWSPDPVTSLGTLRQIAVPANQQWVDTRIDLKAAQRFTINASGIWSNEGPPSTLGPDGYASTYFPNSLLPSANLGALIGKVGDQVFLIGSHIEGASPATGRLYLSMNDVQGTFGDNQGIVDATVTFP